MAPAEIAEQWILRGPALVVVTHGGEGAFAATSAGARVQRRRHRRVAVADTVGAGDSFMGGLDRRAVVGAGCSAPTGVRRCTTSSAATVESVLARCARIAAITVSREGANPPRADELEG